MKKGSDESFNTHQLPLHHIKAFYLYSDGYQDQFGGETRRKLMGRRFRQLLKDSSHKPMPQQKQYLRDFFYGWMKEGNEKQLDDMLVIGAQVGPGKW